jgi:hypothetical protein
VTPDEFQFLKVGDVIEINEKREVSWVLDNGTIVLPRAGTTFVVKEVVKMGIVTTSIFVGLTAQLSMDTLGASKGTFLVPLTYRMCLSNLVIDYFNFTIASIEKAPEQDASRFPHTCPNCCQKAYVGALMVEHMLPGTCFTK